MNRSLPLLAAVSGWFLLCAVQWPWEQQAAQEQQSQTRAATAASSVQGPTATSMALNRAGQAPLEAQKSAPVRNPIPLQNTRKESAAVQTKKPQTDPRDIPQTFTIPAPPRALAHEDTVKMQAKMNDLIQIGQNMNRVNRAKVAEVPGMIAQAKTHQLILAELGSPADTTAHVRKVDAEQVLLHKKLRAIREQTEKQLAEAKPAQN